MSDQPPLCVSSSGKYTAIQTHAHTCALAVSHMALSHSHANALPAKLRLFSVDWPAGLKSVTIFRPVFARADADYWSNSTR